MTAASPGPVWHQALTFLGFAGHQPSPGLVLASGLAALIAVASRRLWPVTRTVVTIAHEGGHALAAMLTGRRLESVWVLRSTAGVTVSAGSRTGPGIVFTSAAGYTAPPVLGLGAAALLATGHVVSMLLISTAALAALAAAIRNVYGMVAVLLTGAVIGVVLWRASPVAEDAFGYALTWFLLLGGVRPVLELQRSRRRRPGGVTDADQLAALTALPAWLWVGVFGVVALAALGIGGYLLLP